MDKISDSRAPRIQSRARGNMQHQLRSNELQPNNRCMPACQHRSYIGDVTDSMASSLAGTQLVHPGVGVHQHHYFDLTKSFA
jgi:hypothetical protein